MLLLGHLALGYLVTYFLLKFLNLGLSVADTHFILVLGTIFGAIVDLDFLSFFIKHKTLRLEKDVSHRDQISHAPIVWLIIGLLIYFFSSDILSKTVGLVLFISVWGHFLFDTFEHGIMWLYPISRKRYRIFKEKEMKQTGKEGLVEHYWKFFIDFYPTTKTFWTELLVIIIFLLVYFKIV